jgi:hypothetical protein
VTPTIPKIIAVIDRPDALSDGFGGETFGGVGCNIICDPHLGQKLLPSGISLLHFGQYMCFFRCQFLVFRLSTKNQKQTP